MQIRHGRIGETAGDTVAEARTARPGRTLSDPVFWGYENTVGESFKTS
jgi:hypothetical protein